MAGAAVAGSAPSLIKPGQAFAATLSPYHDSMTLTLKGVDSLSNALYASYNGDLYESRNMGQSWFRSSISWPPGLDKRTAYFQRWHGLLYCSGTYVDASSTKRMVLSASQGWHMDPRPRGSGRQQCQYQMRARWKRQLPPHRRIR